MKQAFSAGYGTVSGEVLKRATTPSCWVLETSLVIQVLPANHRNRGHLASSSRVCSFTTRPHSLPILRATYNPLRSSPTSSHRPYFLSNPSTSRATILLPPSHRNDAWPHEHATTATSHPNPQLRARPVHRLHALERPLRRYRLALAHRRRVVRLHGARVPERRPAVLVESGDEYVGWGGRRV